MHEVLVVTLDQLPLGDSFTTFYFHISTQKVTYVFLLNAVVV